MTQIGNRRRALILGGGHLGSALARALLERGAGVTVSTRRDGMRANLDGLNVRRVCGDDTAPGQIGVWAPGHDLIIDAAAPYALYLHVAEQSHAVRLIRAQKRMEQLLQAAAANGATLVHVSSILTIDSEYQSSLRRRLIEAAHPYFQLKRRMEALALDAARSGQPVVVVNPSSLLGPWNLRAVYHCIVSAVLTGTLPVTFPEKINVLDVRDAAECILRIVDAGWLGCRVPIVGYDTTMHDVAERVAELGGVSQPRRGRALPVGAALIFAAETALGAAGVKSSYPSLPVLLTLASGWVPMGATQRSLGPVLRPLDDTLCDTIAWHRSRGC